MCLYRFSDSSWFSLGRLYVSKTLSVSSRFSNLLAYCICNIFKNPRVSVESAEISLWFLILFIWVLSLFFFISLVKGLSILFIVSKNHLLVSLIFCIFLDSLFLLWSLLFPFFYSLWALFVILILVPLNVRLDCLFEMILVSWDRPVILWISLLGLLCLCLKYFGLCSHFYLFPGIFWFPLW